MVGKQVEWDGKGKYVALRQASSRDVSFLSCIFSLVLLLSLRSKCAFRNKTAVVSSVYFLRCSRSMDARFLDLERLFGCQV